MRIYFAFSENRNYPLARFLKPGFQHVEALTELDDRLLFHINPRSGRVDYGISSEIKLHEALKTLHDGGRLVVMLRMEKPSPTVRVRRGLHLNCAGYLAYTFGIPFSGITPYQFFKTIIRLGGEIV